MPTILVGLHKAWVQEWVEQAAHSSSTLVRCLHIKQCLLQIGCNYSTFEKEVNWVRVTIRCDTLEHKGCKSTVPDPLATVKIHLNSIMSTLNALCITMHIKDFYYGTHMNDYDCRKSPLDIMSDEIINQCNLLQVFPTEKCIFKSRKECRASRKKAS